MPSAMTTVEELTQLGKQLENQELESPGGVATPQIYGQLLTIYLVQNDLNNAKYLWKRIPAAVKSANPELGNIWTIGQKMWQKDFAGIYEAINKDWSDNLKPTMATLLESTRRRVFNLVAQAYSSVSGDQFAQMMGMTVEEAVQAAVSQDWKADAQTRLVIPVRSAPQSETSVPSEQMLERLTDFVSFLEN
ncbi:COP9 signalosome complex subunit 8 [Lingula anatina]|uniref:COP9 signalosome complex subunit 8 n=1 Tax=Lingula anatina TaxID=7574 RepID=A0A1S3H720_LINAN|nr:COP9 signalosome complex subunit 8 [Lingula anatina]|eukprot:XP_013381777.1 COP9 signalosome complex subunit 8 [Lingula anatina]